MNPGKVSESILKRSVIKTIKYKDDRITDGARVGNDAAITDNGCIVSSAVAGLYMSEENIKFDCMNSLTGAANNVAASGGEAYAVIVDLVVPEQKMESDVKAIMRDISDICNSLRLQIAGGNTEVSKAVLKPVITFTVIGRRISVMQEMDEDLDIVMSKHIGIAGTLILLKEKYSELSKRFQESYLEKALRFEKELSIANEVAVAGNLGVKLMHDVSRGGIFAALWEIGENTGKGLKVYLDKINVRQETIEISEYFGINPYMMISTGSLLMISSNGDELVAELNDKGIEAAVIGKLTEQHDKIILKNEDIRYIDRPKKDELDGII